MLFQHLCFTAAVGGVLAAAAPASALTVTRVEPSSWLSPMDIQPYFSLGEVATIQDSATVPWVSIEATGDATGHYYSFEVDAPGREAWFDIDWGSFGSSLTLSRVETDGLDSLLTRAGGSPDPGSTGNDDAYLRYTFDSAGRYAIGLFAPAGGTYTLNVSLEGAPTAQTQQPPDEDPPLQAVPTPAAAAAGLVGLGILGTTRRRRP